MIEAIRGAMDVSMDRDDNVVVFGEDVGYFGGVFRCTQGLQQKYGKHRCFDAPISELGIVGTAIGMAAYGLRPCVEVQFADYVYPAYDQIVSEAARLRYRSNGQFTCPIVIRMPTGGGIFGGQTHSQSPEALFTHVSGLKTVVPSNPYDAKGLLISAIEDPDPVIFLEPKRLYNGPFDGHHDRPVTPWSKHELGEVPEGYFTVPLGKAAVRRAGSDLTVLAYGTMVYVAEAAAAETGIDVEIIDIRTLLPLDLETIVASVKKTGRCVVVHEATLTSGFGAELACACAGALFLPARSAGCARGRLGHTLSARAGMGLFPGTGARRPCIHRDNGGLIMGEHVIKLPDVGEGVAEAELVEWHVKVGDLVREDTVLAAVMTDKATVEIPSPVDGEILWLGAEIGETIAVGSPLIRLKVEGEGTAEAKPAAETQSGSRSQLQPPTDEGPKPRPLKRRQRRRSPRSRPLTPGCARSRQSTGRAICHRRSRAEGEKPVASPAVRLARKGGGHRSAAGFRVPGQAGRITHEDVEAFVARGPQAVRVTGLAENNSCRGHQGHRSSPQDRGEDVAVQVAHPAYHLCRGDRRHGA